MEKEKEKEKETPCQNLRTSHPALYVSVYFTARLGRVSVAEMKPGSALLRPPD
ncbi:hypothetical protein NQZ68_033492 [Dissostichus eleginoides]|nr:hypothetical protein NQZ68_033492 [Dissostichus eleginoides]